VGLSAETEVQAEIAGAVVAGAAAHLVHPASFCAAQDDAGADGVAVGAGSGELDAEPVVAVFCLVDEQQRAVAEVVDDGLETAIVPQIGDGKAAAGERLDEAGAGGLGDVFEFSVALIPVEEAGLLEGGAEVGGVDLWVDVAVDDEEVGVARWPSPS
jgi:hypothetical protein